MIESSVAQDCNMEYFLVFVTDLKYFWKSAKIVADGSPQLLNILQRMPGKNPFVFSDRNLQRSRPNEKLQHAGRLS